MSVEGSEGVVEGSEGSVEASEGSGNELGSEERSSALEAVREALKASGEEAAGEAKKTLENDPLHLERDADGKFKPKNPIEAAKPEPTVEEDEHALKRVLRERKQIAAEKAQRAQEFQQQEMRLRQFEAKLQYQAQQMQQEMQRLQRLKSDPAAAIRENGWDPEDFILSLAREGTPEGQAMKAQRLQQQKLAELENWKRQQEEAVVRQQEQYKQRQAQMYRQQVEQQFTSLAMNPEKHPNLAEMYADATDELLAKADVIAEKYRKLTGKEASLEEVAEYLEERAEAWYRSISTKRGSAPKGTKAGASATQGKSTQGSATGRTLSPEDASERRSLGTQLKDLDGDERLAAAREAVGAAIRASGSR